MSRWPNRPRDARAWRKANRRLSISVSSETVEQCAKRLGFSEPGFVRRWVDQMRRESASMTERESAELYERVYGRSLFSSKENPDR